MPTKHKVLFLTERSPRHQKDALVSAPADLEIVMLRRPAHTEILQQIQDSEFLITERTGVLDATMLAAAPKLRLVQRLGSLTYDIDVMAAQQAGIPVCAWPIRGCMLVAEHMLMQMLALVKHLPEVAAIANYAAEWGRPARRTDENTFAYNWSGRTGIDGLYAKTVGIWGFGEIGAELARRLSGFRPQQILYHKRQPLPANVERALGLTYTSQTQLIAESDFLCCLLPFYPETELMLNAAVFASMKQGAFIVHCGSGSVIDEAALSEALRSGQLAGAALDTYEWEPLRADNPLLSLARNPAANVLLTPHTAAGTSVPGTRARDSDYANIRRLLDGQPLLHQVNP